MVFFVKFCYIRLRYANDTSYESFNEFKCLVVIFKLYDVAKKLTFSTFICLNIRSFVRNHNLSYDMYLFTWAFTPTERWSNFAKERPLIQPKTKNGPTSNVSVPYMIEIVCTVHLYECSSNWHVIFNTSYINVIPLECKSVKIAQCVDHLSQSFWFANEIFKKDINKINKLSKQTK